jgi:hypothetical protein
VPIAFDGRGVAHLSQWAPYSIRQRRGTVRFARVEREGRPVLQIAAGPGGGSGAWRARALLEAGVYRFEGRVQTRETGPRDGVGLRIRGVRSSWIRLPDGEWTELSHRFAVPEGLAEFEFICEFQAIDGEAWFAEESLRLVRE